MITYHSAPWHMRFFAVLIDLSVFGSLFILLSPGNEFLKNYPGARILIWFMPIYYLLYKFISMLFFSRTLGMWFFGLNYFEIDANGSLLKDSLYSGITINKSVKRIAYSILFNCMLGIPYLQLLYSLDSLHSLDRKSQVFVIARMVTNKDEEITVKP